MPRTYEVNKTELLLHYIKCRRHTEAKFIIKQNVAASSDYRGKLLHCAAYYNNEVIVRHLIALGTDVDSIDKRGMTPLMLAVQLGHLKTTVVLLEADANIDITTVDGKNALQMAFQLDHDKWRIVEAFFLRIKIDTFSTEQFVERIFKAGCTLHYATLGRNIEILQGLLERGIDINSRNRNGETALHVASEASNLKLVEWLINNGADVNILDNNQEGPLFRALRNGNVAVIQMLLKQAANPNSSNNVTPLLIVVLKGRTLSCSQIYDNCLELLLQHGAVPPTLGTCCSTFFKFVFLYASIRQIHCLIACLAMFDVMGTTVDMDSIVLYAASKVYQVKRYFELCQQQLNVTVFRKKSLLDLLTHSHCGMKLYVRDETFLPVVEDFCRKHELREVFSYYYNTLMKHIDETTRAVNLENQAVSVICDLFNENRNKGYIAAIKVVDYLHASDIEKVAQLM